MNCKQAEELLPQYAGRELDEKRRTLVTEHLKTCLACARLTDEYRDCVQLTEKFAPPVFSEGVYAGIRQRVMREIEVEAITPAWSQTIANFFSPRLTWAIGGALLIVVSMFAIYFIVNKGNDKQQLADTPPAATEGSDSRPQPDERAVLPPSVNKGGKEQLLASVPQPKRKRSRNTIVDRTTIVVAKSRDAMSTAKNVSPEASSLPQPMVFPPRDSSALDKTLRVEIQTNDPNIRIIWFTQQEIKPTTPSTKGI